MLPKNNIINLCPLNFLHKVVVLNLEKNHLVALKKNCFSKSIFLTSLQLNDNSIYHLNDHSFNNLSQLKFLDISNNPLSNLPSKCFKGALHLKLLNTYNINFKSLETDSLSSTFIKVIKTSDFKISCASPVYSIATTNPPWYISCSSILPNLLLKQLYWLVYIVIFLFNITSIVVHILHKNGDRRFQVKVFAVNTSDILCGCYLSIICIADLMFKEVYVRNIWKSHPLCFAAFGTVFWFTTSSQIFLIYLCVARATGSYITHKSNDKNSSG